MSNLPFIYKVEIEQGNVVNADMVNQLHLGMTKEQVIFVMGEPLLTDPFHNDRWDYYYSLKTKGKLRDRTNLTLHFKNDKLFYLDGDFPQEYPNA